MNFTRLQRKIRRIPAKIRRTRDLLKFTLVGDGVAVRCKNTSFMDERDFAEAWHKAVEWNGGGYAGVVPDIRWRAHVVCWAARNVLSLEGDFVECGVHTGLLSATIVNYVDLEGAGKKFYLFDTFAGIPTDNLDQDNTRKAEAYNAKTYRDVWDIVTGTFGELPYARLVRGTLPGTLNSVDLDKICYLSIDLNIAYFERLVIEELWDKMVSGAHIILDDYAFEGHEEQYDMWNEFASKSRRTILTLPTGQGLMVK